MSYIGNTPTQQNFVAGADQFSGNGSTTAFTLSRNVNTVFDIFVAISNVPQDPYSAYSVSGNTLTFTSAPPSGTGNIYVTYRATNVQTFVPTPGVSAQFGLGSAAAPSMTFIGDTNTGIYSPAADTLAFVEGGAEAMRIDSSGNVGIGTSSPNYKLNVGSTSAVTSLQGVGLTLFTTGSLTSSTGGVLNFRPGNGTTTSDIYNLSMCAYDHSGDSNADGLSINAYDGISFCTGSNSRQERARIDASGIFSCLATQSAAASGYVKLPSGIYIQWGTANASTGGTTSNFPIAFPNSAWSMVAVNNNQTNPPAPSTLILSLSQFRLTVVAGGPNCYFIAIGN